MADSNDAHRKCDFATNESHSAIYCNSIDLTKKSLGLQLISFVPSSSSSSFIFV